MIRFSKVNYLSAIVGMVEHMVLITYRVIESEIYETLYLWKRF